MALAPKAKRRRTSNLQRSVGAADAYEVEEILGYELNSTAVLRFVVKWEGYDELREFLFTA